MTVNFNRRKIILCGSAVLGVNLLLKACSNNQTTTPTTENSSKWFKVAIALPGSSTDQAWNQSGYEGINQVKQKLCAEVAFAQLVNQAIAQTGSLFLVPPVTAIVLLIFRNQYVT